MTETGIRKVLQTRVTSCIRARTIMVLMAII